MDAQSNMTHEGDVANDHHPRRCRCRCRPRFAPYDAAANERRATHIADAVDRALTATATAAPRSPQAATTLQKRRALANKLRLAAQSAANMATYLERRAVLEREHQNRLQEIALGEDGDRTAQDDDDDSDVTVCCICLESVRPRCAESPTQALRCGHVFHRACIREWLRHRRCCPVDRSEPDDLAATLASGALRPRD